MTIFAIFAIDVFPFFTNQRGWGKAVMPLKFGPWRSKHLGTLIQTEFRSGDVQVAKKLFEYLECSLCCILGNKEVPKIENVRGESVALRVEIKYDLYTVSF